MPDIWVGPINFDALNADAGWISDVNNQGFRQMSVSGLIEIQKAEELNEYIGSYERRITFGNYVGVLDFFYIERDFLKPLNGWYLFTGASIDADQASGPGEYTHFALSGLNIPSGRIVISRTARVKADDFSLSPKSILAQPLWSSPEGGAWEMEPGGTGFFREYDTRTFIDINDLTNTGRLLSMRQGDLT